MADSDGAAIGGEFREDFGERPVVAKLSIVDEEHDGRRGELLGAGGEAEVGLGVDVVEGAEVADSVAALEDGAAMVADEDCESGGGPIGEGGEDGIDLLGERGGGDEEG
jgi:hypothetical protein